MLALSGIGRLALVLACCTFMTTPGLAANVDGQASKLYVALTSGNAVSIYAGLEGRKPVGQITEGVVGPVALTTDASGTLYVANSNNTITAYAHGATSPSATYTQGVGRPIFLATGPDGSLYASDPGAQTVVQFAPFSTVPTRTITFATGPLGIAVDHEGNLYVVVGTDIERFAPGATQGKSMGFDLINGPSFLGFDPNGDFAVVQSAQGDQARGGVMQSQEGVAVFTRQAPHNFLRSFGFPVSSPTGFAFSADGASLYISDAQDGRVVRAVYPQGNFANVIDGVAGSSGGVAVYPAFVP